MVWRHRIFKKGEHSAVHYHSSRGRVRAQRLERVEGPLLHREIEPRRAAAPLQSIIFSAFRSISWGPFCCGM